jgi:thiol-disulfide isomerase/thioredoxin
MRAAEPASAFAFAFAFASASAFALAGCSKTEEHIRPISDPAAVTAPTSGVSGKASPPTTSASATAGKLRVIKPPADAEIASFLRTERLRAKADGRVLVVYAGAKWCDPCKHFHALLDAGKLDAKLARMTLVELDVDQDTDRLAAAGYKYRYVPYFALVRADGQPDKQIQETGKDVSEDTIEDLALWQDEAP